MKSSSAYSDKQVHLPKSVVLRIVSPSKMGKLKHDGDEVEIEDIILRARGGDERMSLRQLRGVIYKLVSKGLLKSGQATALMQRFEDYAT